MLVEHRAQRQFCPRVSLAFAGMGYTHYFRYEPNHPSFRAGWAQMVRDAQRIVERVQAAGVVIEGFDDEPPVSTARIAFDSDEEEELDGESFVISPTAEQEVVRTFCKTERFPYDLAVTAILLRCRLIAPDAFWFGSDGDWDDDWDEDATWPSTGLSTRGLVAELFGECPAESPFSEF
jgi:hypothetical protein